MGVPQGMGPRTHIEGEVHVDCSYAQADEAAADLRTTLQHWRNRWALGPQTVGGVKVEVVD